jgi:hypothetical protein
MRKGWDIGESYEATVEAGVKSASSCSFSPIRLKWWA